VLVSIGVRVKLLTVEGSLSGYWRRVHWWFTKILFSVSGFGLWVIRTSCVVVTTVPRSRIYIHLPPAVARRRAIQWASRLTFLSADSIAPVALWKALTVIFLWCRGAQFFAYNLYYFLYLMICTGFIWCFVCFLCLFKARCMPILLFLVLHDNEMADIAVNWLQDENNEYTVIWEQLRKVFESSYIAP
jgi:hypothetical protein